MINVPNPSPNAPTFNPPQELINQYLNRKPPAQVAVDNIGQSIGALAQYQQQKQARQLEALKALSELYASGGPKAIQNYGQTINNAAGSNIIPTQPPQQSAGGGLPTNAPDSPSASAQTLQQPSQQSPQGNNNLVMSDQGQQNPPQSNIPESIRLSLNAGHPDYTGQMRNIIQQMGNYNDQGAYGQKQQLGLNYQLQGVRGLQDASQFQQNQDREAQQFNTAQNNEKGRAFAGVSEKTVPSLTAVSNLDTAYHKLEKINSDPGNFSIPLTGDLGVKYAKAVPSTTSKWALNQKAADSQAVVAAGALEKLVEGRYNDEQMKRIMSAMIPTGNELGTPVGRQKLDFFRDYVAQMKAGAVIQANASINAIAGGGPFNPSSVSLPQSSSTQQPQTQIPQGRITVKSPSGQIGHIPKSQLKQALAEGYTQQ